MRRSLSLARETLTDLTPADLGAVDGGAVPITDTCHTFPVLVCLSYPHCTA